MLVCDRWRVSAHDDREIYSASGDVFIGTIASPQFACLIAATPQFLELAFDLAEQSCTCGSSGLCVSCRAERLILRLEPGPER